MSNGKIVVGPATHQVESKKKGLYAGKRSGRVVQNGGFGNNPTVTFTSISQEEFDRVFPNSFKPKWMDNK
jgi:hypothetical protein